MSVGFFVKAKLAEGVSLLDLLTIRSKIIPLFAEAVAFLTRELSDVYHFEISSSQC